MDTEKKYNLKKSKAILLFAQMILTIFLFIASIYLLFFVIKNKLGGWMITSYIFITISIIAIIIYSVYGYKKTDAVYQAAILPFLLAIFVNIMLPNRETFQVGLLSLLLAFTFAFLLRQKDYKFTNIISIIMILIALVFSIYSAINANTQFLGDIKDNWPTYLAMYLSIFIPTIMSSTFALTYNVRYNRSIRK